MFRNKKILIISGAALGCVALYGMYRAFRREEQEPIDLFSRDTISKPQPEKQDDEVEDDDSGWDTEYSVDEEFYEYMAQHLQDEMKQLFLKQRSGQQLSAHDRKRMEQLNSDWQELCQLRRQGGLEKNVDMSHGDAFMYDGIDDDDLFDDDMDDPFLEEEEEDLAGMWTNPRGHVELLADENLSDEEEEEENEDYIQMRKKPAKLTAKQLQKRSRNRRRRVVRDAAAAAGMK